MPHICPWWGGYFIDNPLRRLIHNCLKPGGKLLVAEPKLHVPGKAFRQTMTLAENVGFQPTEQPRVWGCRAIVLEKG